MVVVLAVEEAGKSRVWYAGTDPCWRRTDTPEVVSLSGNDWGSESSVAVPQHSLYNHSTYFYTLGTPFCCYYGGDDGGGDFCEWETSVLRVEKATLTERMTWNEILGAFSQGERLLAAPLVFGGCPATPKTCPSWSSDEMEAHGSYVFLYCLTYPAWASQCLVAPCLMVSWLS